MKVGSTLKEKVKKILIGEADISDFKTVGISDDSIRERVYLKTREKVFDVSGKQWLLGLDPRVMGIWVENTDDKNLLHEEATCQLFFLDSDRRPECAIQREATAMLKLKLLTTIEEENGALLLFGVFVISYG